MGPGPLTALSPLRYNLRMPDWDWTTVAVGVSLVVAGLLLAAIVAWRRSGYPLALAFLYSINWLITTGMWRVKVSGRLPVKRGEATVVVSNHISGIDPLLIQRSTDCIVRWMVAKEYVVHPAMGWAFRILQVIPVNRGGVDTASTKQAIRSLQNGEVVGMFPEGRINRTPAQTFMLPGRVGAAMVALRGRAKVVPVYVAGSPYNGTALGSMLMRANARVIVGEPMDISEFFDRATDRAVLEELTRRFMKAIANLSGHEEFEPTIAGRKWTTEADDVE